MNRLPVIDDCETAADVMIRARRVLALRFKRVRPIAALPAPIHAVADLTVSPSPKKEPKPEPPIDLPNFLALPPYQSQVVIWPPAGSRPILRRTAEYFQITVEHLLSDGRHRPLVQARWIAMFLLKKLKHLSYPEIGRRFGRDHTTVLHGVRRVAAAVCAGDEKFVEPIAEIERRLGL